MQFFYKGLLQAIKFKKRISEFAGSKIISIVKINFFIIMDKERRLLKSYKEVLPCLRLKELGL
jgi:hypothetical protein